jgi:hypothetical protein
MSQLWPYAARLVGNTHQTAAGKPFLIVAIKGRYLTLRLTSAGKERRVQLEEIEATEAVSNQSTPTPSNDAMGKSKVSETSAPYLASLVQELRRIADMAETVL